VYTNEQVEEREVKYVRKDNAGLIAIWSITLSLGFVAFIPSDIKGTDVCLAFAIAQLSNGGRFPFSSSNHMLWLFS